MSRLSKPALPNKPEGLARYKYLFYLDFDFLRMTFCVSEMQAELETQMDGGEAEEGGRAPICDQFFSSLANQDLPFIKSDL